MEIGHRFVPNRAQPVVGFRSSKSAINHSLLLIVKGSSDGDRSGLVLKYMLYLQQDVREQGII